MKFSKEIVINAPASKVWEVMAHDFVNIGKWATSVPHSGQNSDAPKVNGSPVGGRMCSTSLGKIFEEFTAYDEDKMTFSFKGVITSKMFDKLISTTAISAKDDKTSITKITPEIDLTFLGKLMYPMIRMNLSHTLNIILDDLKYYVENGEPSPRKVKSMAKK